MPRTRPADEFRQLPPQGFDLVVIGSGFGSLFYLHECLAHLPPDARIAVLERGTHSEHHRQIEMGANATLPDDGSRPYDAEAFYGRPSGHKPWNFTIGLGGGKLCWWGQAPRLHPSDFRMSSLYDQGADWPVGYDDLEPFYCDAEDIMGVAGDSARVGPFHRTRPYPLPAFRGSSVDEALREIDGDQIALPAARDSLGLARAQCCAFGNCRLCPNDAKFTALNGLSGTLEDPRVTLVTGAEVLTLELEAGVAKRAVVRTNGTRFTVAGDLLVLGANAIYNPAILARSGLDHSELGRGINEQLGYGIEVKLTDLSGVNGGTSATGQNLRLIDGPDRRTRGAAVFYFDNRWKSQALRAEKGKHLNTLQVIINVEDRRSHDHWVEIPGDWDAAPIVHHRRHTAYAEDGLRRALEVLPTLFDGIGVDGIEHLGPRATESHLQCTTPAGDDPATSLVDADLLHHRVRNLAVVGTGAFPTCPVGNPSLTAAAWSLRAARRQFERV